MIIQTLMDWAILKTMASNSEMMLDYEFANLFYDALARQSGHTCEEIMAMDVDALPQLLTDAAEELKKVGDAQRSLAAMMVTPVEPGQA